MASELALDKERARLAVPLRIKFKVRRYFAKPGDRSLVDAYIRALEEATRKFDLTKEDYEAIGAIVEENRKSRMKRRNENFFAHGIKLRGVRKATQAKMDAMKATYADGGIVSKVKKNTKKKGK